MIKLCWRSYIDISNLIYHNGDMNYKTCPTLGGNTHSTERSILQFPSNTSFQK